MTARPNILWILTTQWRAQAGGFAGDPDARTPHLDALARRATNYVQAVTPHPFGPFARAAVLTGVPSPANGVAEYHDPLPAGAPTIARVLGGAGYTTAYFGKWHLAERDRAAPLVGETHARQIVPPGARGGFDFWEGFEGGFLLNDPWLHGTRLPQPVRFRGYQSDVLCQRAGDWLQRAGPWFAVVSLEAPHPPYDAPAGGIPARDPSALHLAANVPASAAPQARRELSGYHAHLEATDRAIGGLLARLDPGRTIIVFTSVHGDMHGAHGHFRKGWPYEESVRVPLLVQTPGGAAGCDESCRSLLDLPALTLGWAGLTSPLEPAPAAARISMPSVVALRHQCDRRWTGLRTRQRKLVLDADGHPWLYFNLESDPGERINLAHDPACAGEIARLRAELQRGAVPGSA